MHQDVLVRMHSSLLMTHQDFVEMLDREKPATLEGALVRRVEPQPWFLRGGSGKDAKIRLELAGHRYERQPGESTWHRVDEWTEPWALKTA